MHPLPYPPFRLRQLTICLLLPLTTSAFALEDTTLPTVMVTATPGFPGIVKVSLRDIAFSPSLPSM